ncbi:MAG: hypothetical protein KHX55_02405 [Proteobacteria bacterium]|nr:hypothetical protein [Pseudomonadota bacterium]
MTDTARVLRHIAELYAKPRKNQSFDEAVFELEDKLNERFQSYDNAFGRELTANVLKAVDDFWRYKSDKSRPTVAQIMAMVNSDSSKAANDDFSQPIQKIVTGRNIEVEYMQRDIDLKRNTHCLLNDYTRAVTYILDELLPQKIGYSEYQNIRKDYSAKVNLAMRNNLFADFDTILLEVYNRYHGIEAVGM